MALGFTLGLHQFSQRLILNPSRGLCSRQWTAVRVRGLEHIAVAQVRIMRDSQEFTIAGAILLKQVPQLLDAGGFKIAKRAVRHIIIAENHITVKVRSIPKRRIFIRHEGGELTRVVEIVCELLHLLPHAGDSV